jgi:hypothetical protein
MQRLFLSRKIETQRPRPGSATPLTVLRSQGYLPAALLHAVALCGWDPHSPAAAGGGGGLGSVGAEAAGESAPEAEEALSKEELARRFELGRVQRGAARLSPSKLASLNGRHLRRALRDSLAAAAGADAGADAGAAEDACGVLAGAARPVFAAALRAQVAAATAAAGGGVDVAAAAAAVASVSAEARAVGAGERDAQLLALLELFAERCTIVHDEGTCRPCVTAWPSARRMHTHAHTRTRRARETGGQGSSAGSVLLLGAERLVACAGTGPLEQLASETCYMFGEELLPPLGPPPPPPPPPALGGGGGAQVLEVARSLGLALGAMAEAEEAEAGHDEAGHDEAGEGAGPAPLALGGGGGGLPPPPLLTAWAGRRRQAERRRAQMAAALGGALAEHGARKGQVLPRLRRALTGTKAGADVLGTMALLGPATAARRLAAAIADAGVENEQHPGGISS